MSYRSEKLSKEKLKQNIFRIVLLVLCGLLAGLCVFSAFVPMESWRYHVGLPEVSTRQSGELRVHYLDAENGVCTLVELPDGKTVLVGGGADDGEAKKQVLRFLNALKIERIDALVVPDITTRGVGVLRELVRYYTVGKAYLLEKEGTNATYEAFLADLDREQIPRYTAAFGTLMEGEDYTLRILYPLEDGQSTEELVLTLSYGGTEILLGGRYGEDTLRAIEAEKSLRLLEKWGVVIERFDVVQLRTDADVDTLRTFLVELQCRAVVFSCRGGKNDTPTEECLNLLQEYGIAVYRTDENGYITLTLSQGGYTFTTQK
jgi:beta-lactamase superfamily II metal-dependent hydrolase